MNGQPKPALKIFVVVGIVLGIAEAATEHYWLGMHDLAGQIGAGTSTVLGLVSGYMWASTYPGAAAGGALVGGACAFFGILVAVLIHDQPLLGLLTGTIGGALVGAVGALIGRAVSRRR